MADKVKDEKETEVEYVSLNLFKTFDNVGDAIEGQYLGTTSIDMDGQPLDQHVMLTSEGIVKFNSSAQLSSLTLMPRGSRIKVTFKGVIKGSRVKAFDIQMPKASFDKYVESGLTGTLPELPHG